VARSSLASSPVTCAVCGAKVRADRAKCLRCGKPLTPREGGDAPATYTGRTKLLAGFATFGIVMLAGLWSFAPRPTTHPGLAPVQVPTATPPREPITVAAVAATARDESAPAIASYAAGDIDGALRRFKQAVARDPDDAEALNNLGQLLVRADRAVEAVEYFDRAIARQPGAWAYRFNRARALGILGQWDAAVDGYRDAARLFPDDYVTHFNLAKALQKKGDLNAAIETFERAIQLAPGEADFHLSHGLALEAAKRPNAAAAAYRKYLELAANRPEADKVRGRIALLEKTTGGAPAAGQP